MRPRALQTTLVAGGVLALVLVARAAGGEIPRLATWIASLGAWGPFVYVAAYVVATLAFVPGALPTAAAGPIFGLAEGTLYAFVGETLGGAAAFLVARNLARPLVARRIAGTPRFAALDRAVAAQGLRVVFLLRLSPVFPFNVLNYVLGTTSVRFSHYLVASVGMLPGALLYVYYGKVAGDVAALAAGAPNPGGSLYWIVLGLGLVATVLVTTVLARVATRALREAAGPVV